MAPNIDGYKRDLEKLIDLGTNLMNAMRNSVYQTQFQKQLKTHLKTDEKVNKFIKELPDFNTKYQYWYSESIIIIKQLLPDRLGDFTKYYEKQKTRKAIDVGNYVIEDYLQGVTVTRPYDNATLVGRDAAIPQFQQQLSILKSIEARFESSLFDIRQLVQADFLDSELAAAKELLKHKFTRAAGAIVGVVLEKHLGQVATDHNITVKKNASINDLNEALKKAHTIDTSQWRFIQHLGDIRNNCSHSKDKEPSIQDVEDLISGVDKIIKTIF